MQHISVMGDEVLEYLDICDGMNVVDATAGAGGHTAAMLNRVGPTGRVCAIDTDPLVIKWLTQRFASEIAHQRLIVVKGNFRFLAKILPQEFVIPVDRILFDLGVSLDQLIGVGRGFSFTDETSFDMRFSQGTQGEYNEDQPTAADVVNTYSAERLEQILYTYGNDPDAKRHARALVTARFAKGPIRSSAACAQILWHATPRARRAKGRVSAHPATQALQAIRIYINDEYENLRLGLITAHEVLIPYGRCGAITFHSGEDRIVKLLFRRWEREGKGEVITPKSIQASAEERKRNPRARSAHIRVFQKKK